MTFATILRQLKRQHYPTVRAFAAALDMDASHLSRAMGRRGQPFDIRGCLRLAQVTGANAGEILRAAGKGEVATQIEELYGAPRDVITPDQGTLIYALEAITDPVVRRSLLDIALALSSQTMESAGLARADDHVSAVATKRRSAQPRHVASSAAADFHLQSARGG